MDQRISFVTLAHNVPTPADVDTVLELTRRAGSGDVAAGQQRDRGGYTGYFADPDGFRWEVAHNPGPIGQAQEPITEATPFAQHIARRLAADTVEVVVRDGDGVGLHLRGDLRRYVLTKGRARDTAWFAMGSTTGRGPGQPTTRG